jgi:SNF2 family DNA or RNA helicase
MEDLGFTKVYNKEIVLNKKIDDKNIRLIRGSYRSLYIVDINDLTESDKNSEYIRSLNTDHTIWYCPFVLNYYHINNNIIYPYLDIKTNEELLKETIKIISCNSIKYTNPNSINQSNFIIKINKLDTKYYITYYINNDILNLIKNNKRTNKIDILRKILIEQKKIELTNSINTELINFSQPINSKINVEQEIEKEILKNPIKLYNYQMQDVQWMKNIENEINNNQNIISYDNSSMYFVLDNTFLIYNSTLFPNNDTLFPNNDTIKTIHTIHPNKISFKYYGGNLISEVGLGKTIVALYHILSSDLEERVNHNFFVEFSDDCNYFYKRGKNKGKNCSKLKLTNNFYCKEHKSSIFIEKKSIILKNLDSFDPESFIININPLNNNLESNFIKTNSNLILCPSHLCDQWIQEYYTKFLDTHRVLLIVTYDQYTNLTLADILFSDIVIVSYNFLLNRNYIKNKPKNFVLDNFNLNDGDKSKLLNSKIFNCLNLFYWNRVICDEAHEINSNGLNNNQLSHIINGFSSKYKWNITATPFANGINGFINLMSYSSDYVNTSSVTYYNNYNDLSVSNLLNLGFNSDTMIINECKKLFRKNTKLSIQNEYSGNILIHHIKSLNFTIQERSLYNSYLTGTKTKYSDFLIKLCCHPELNNETKQLVKNCKTFTEIQKVILDWNKTQLEIEKNKIDIFELDIEYYQTELNELDEYILNNQRQVEDELELIETYRLKLATLKRNLTISKKKYNEIFRTWNYLKTSVDELQSNNICLTCPICLDDIDTDNIVITKCGHKFCWECIYETHKTLYNHNTIKCPTCNNVMSNKDIYLLNNIENENIIYSELDDIIQNVKSTKIGNIIHFLKTSINKGDKVILFSQWDELLHKVGNMIQKYNIIPLYCNGTVYNRKRVINQFCTDPSYNLIMLSSKNCASGINLTIANKIIFLEPIYGTQEYRYNIESQAIGRCDRISQTRPIEIYHFIIKDTIEEDIINNLIDDSQMTIKI